MAVNGPKVDNRAVLGAEGCHSLAEWLDHALVRVDRELGFERSSIVLVLDPRVPALRRAFAGASRGLDPSVLDQYFARWAESDPLATAAAKAMFEADGCASTAALYGGLDSTGRRFVDEFLARHEIADQLSILLEGNGTTNGYLTIHERHAVAPGGRSALLALASELAGQLRTYLPVGLPARLSPREREVAELVAFGFANREIAAILNVGPDTAKKYVQRVMSKVGVDRRTRLAVSWTTGRMLVIPG